MSIKDGTIYVDFPGKFLIRSLDSMVDIFIVYNCITDAIIATPIKNMKEETIAECFKQNIEYLSKRNSKPVLNIIDNVASRAVHACLYKENVYIQLVKPHNHRVNAAERKIRTFKKPPNYGTLHLRCTVPITPLG